MLIFTPGQKLLQSDLLAQKCLHARKREIFATMKSVSNVQHKKNAANFFRKADYVLKSWYSVKAVHSSLV